MKVTILIPVYRAQENLKLLYDRLSSTLIQLNLNAYEILFVEDAGNDNSWEIIQFIASKDHNVHGIQLSRNYGQHNALLCGIRAAQYEIIVTMDDDLQNPPEEIPKLLHKLSEGYDVVYGTPQKEQHGFFRNCASRITKYVLQEAMDAHTARNISAFRVFRTELRQSFDKYHSPFVSIDVLLSWGTTSFTTVTVEHHPRHIGSSGYTLRKLIMHAVNMMTGFSTLPLQLASILGFITSLFGLFLLGYVILRYFFNISPVPGFSFLAAIITIFSGIQLFSLGIIGEYLARMHFGSMGRAPYSMRECTKQLIGKENN